MGADPVAAALAELDARWLALSGGRPHVRPMLQIELDQIEPALPPNSGALVLVTQEPDGCIHRHAAAVTLEALRELGLPSAKRLAELLEADTKPARARSLN